MAAEERQPGVDLTVHPIHQQLLDAAHRFNFFKAVHLLERFAGGRAPGKGLRPADDPVRFTVPPGFGFPASDIQQIVSNGNGGPPRMAVNFMGLVGPKGILPDWYNTHAQDRNFQKDYCFTDFLDLFHQRLLSIFYLAWKKYRLAENYHRDGIDSMSHTLASLAGIGERERRADPDFFSFAQKRLIHFCGLVARTVPTGAAIETIVSQATGAPVRIEQFVERLIPIHVHDRTRLGRRNSTMNRDALCGRHIRDAGSFFRVHIGPMTWERYQALGPRSRNLEMIRRLIAYLAGIEYEFEVRLIIRGRDIPAIGLGAHAPAPRLGRTVLLRRPERSHDKDVVVQASGASPTAQVHATKGNHGEP
ncbi:MAG: type VI secretion system baseplate subunit TssG [Desulfatitalea sp.]|nr:type VI secretion system baseplate subunit TssG [Desulfatitalea sp.]